jgi:DNA repair exonuclease SbcCD ATPase subunit
MQKDIAAAGVDLAEARNQVEKLRQSVQEGHGVIEQRQHELQQIQRQIDEETKKLKGFNDELDSLKEAINGRRSDIVESELEIAQIDKDVEKAKREAKEAADKVAKRESEFEWIADECQCVGLSAFLFFCIALFETDSALSRLQDLRQGELAVQLYRHRYAQRQGQVPPARGEPPGHEAQGQPQGLEHDRQVRRNAVPSTFSGYS